jgi:hypothetical protein
MLLSESEKNIWIKPIRERIPKKDDSAINEKYRAGEQRIVTESNREKLPNFVKALEKPGYMQIRPFYQRRKRWDQDKCSALIESFIMNIPVPPLFLYERDFNQYEVMDGQQRITALKTFYSGEYKLKGLQIWPELNGRTYSTLPSQIRQGLDRRSISYIVVLKESTPDDDDAIFLRQTVFERLNTGGVKLEHQEIRNCMFQGKFNELLIELTQIDDFRDAFDLPRYSPSEEEEPGAIIKDKSMYEKMADAEVVLRFFTLRHVDKFVRGMQGFLDLYMARTIKFTDEDIDFLRTLYKNTINLATKIYGEIIFRPYNTDQDQWVKNPSRSFYDAVMVGLSLFLESDNILVDKRNLVIERTKRLFLDNPIGTFTGRANNKDEVVDRIDKYVKMINGILS